MARLLIVSRSMALAMRLADQHEVAEHSADELDALLPLLDADTDVLVLDLGDPVLAVNTVNSLREAEQAVPVLLVSGYQPEWEQVEAQQVDGVHVVPLPITRSALLQGVAVLTGIDPAVVETEAAVESAAAERAEAKTEPTTASAPTAPVVVSPVEAPSSPVETPAVTAAGPAAAAPTPAPARPVSPVPVAASTARAPGEAPSWGSPPRTGEVPAVTPSDDVTGLSYSQAITRPFDQEPRTGQFPINRGGPTTSAPTRWARNVPNSGNLPPAGATPPGGEPLPGTTNGNAMARRMQRLGNRPRKLQRRPGIGEVVEPRTPGMGLVTDPLGPRTDPYGFPASDLDRRLDAEAAAMVTRGGAENGFAMRTAELVRLLHERAGDLYSVSDTAQVLADDVIERASADAAAILVPDGPIWRVSGGVGLRPLERRLELLDSHWLITEIGSAGRAVLIEDTDIIRQQLSGAPLAAWRHLLAVPVPDIRGIVVLARGQEGGPFSDRDLSAVIAPVREAAALLAQAVETRRLARMLAPLCETDPAPRLSRS